MRISVYTPYVSWFRPSRQSAPNSFYIPISLLMLAIFHGASIFKVLSILAINYVLAKVTGEYRGLLCRKRGYSTWVMLLADKRYEGYTFATLHPAFAFLVSRCSLILSFSCHSTDNLDRMTGVAYTCVGPSASTSPCYALPRSTLTTTGHVPGPVSRMYNTDNLVRVSQNSVLTLWPQSGKAVSDKKRAAVFHTPEMTHLATILSMLSTLRCTSQGP
jgi:hypothetical protein